MRSRGSFHVGYVLQIESVGSVELFEQSEGMNTALYKDLHLPSHAITLIV